MAAGSRPAGREPRLDPVRWRAPGRGVLLRTALAATALLVAAGALHAGQATGPDAGQATRPDAGQAGHPDTGQAAQPDGQAAQPDGQAAGPDTGHGGRAEPGPNARTGGAAARPAPAEAASGGPAAGGGTDARLAVPPGMVGVPVRLGEVGALAVLRAGHRIDLLAVPPAGGTPTAVATGALVLGVVGDVGADGMPGAVYLALTRAQARRIIGAAENTRFAALVRP